MKSTIGHTTWAHNIQGMSKVDSRLNKIYTQDLAEYNKGLKESQLLCFNYLVPTQTLDFDTAILYSSTYPTHQKKSIFDTPFQP